MDASRPQLIFGTGIVGDADVSTFADAESVSSLLGKLLSLNINRIDTAARYPSTRPTQSETLLGAAGVSEKDFLIDTKIIVKGREVEGHLAPEKVQESVAASLARLRVTEVNTLYNHAPDPVTPLEEQVKAFDEQHKKGACVQIGLSNLPTDMLRRWLELCDEKGYTKPKVYQGQYNVLAREAEEDLFPLLRKHGIVFAAYSPLASGLLTGSFSQGAGGGMRFTGGGAISDAVRAWSDKPEIHDAIRMLIAAVEPHGIAPIDAALRWIYFHSALNRAGDAIILGASKTAQIERSVATIKDGPLPRDVLAGIEDLWKTLRAAKAKAAADA